MPWRISLLIAATLVALAIAALLGRASATCVTTQFPGGGPVVTDCGLGLVTPTVNISAIERGDLLVRRIRRVDGDLDPCP